MEPLHPFELVAAALDQLRQRGQPMMMVVQDQPEMAMARERPTMTIWTVLMGLASFSYRLLSSAL